ncbi:snapalysin [Streptomyces sp. J2-1]|uniref:snapalysin n=1 Tax=Streptomyces corallincola TaxID=2851888 RepID=UPI001C38F6CD|nr:snapalysin [Streptomyces corallincola]MBV2354166.1 snapalysin [Streptomyces corallincola]
MRLRTSRTLSAAALGLALTGLGAVPAVAAPASAAPTAATQHAWTAYDGSQQEGAANQAFLKAVLKSVAEKRAAHPDAAAAVTITYDPSGAPSFQSQIANAASVWNSSVSNVKLSAGGSGSDFSYREGNDSRGSYASTDGHGSGFVFLDYAQNEEYSSNRVVAHETGHVLGLPDDYSGPCGELMSGGGPGTSCTNDRPNSTEISEVNSLWANGIAGAMKAANIR